MAKRRRGTVIVDTEQGILLVLERGGREFLLPGGGAEKGESRLQAAVRELKEETGLEPYLVAPLFRFLSQFGDHTVYYIKANGQPAHTQDAYCLGYYQHGRVEAVTCRPDVPAPEEIKLSRSARAIIKRYQQHRRDNPDWFAALDRAMEFKQYTYDVGEE